MLINNHHPYKNHHLCVIHPRYHVIHLKEVITNTILSLCFFCILIDSKELSYANKKNINGCYTYIGVAQPAPWHGPSSYSAEARLREEMRTQDPPMEITSKSATAMALTPVRTSVRLANVDKTSILSKAVSRKMRQREGGDGFATAPSLKKIIQKSRRSGVILEGVEAKKFAEFTNI